MHSQKYLFERMLAPAGIMINGNGPADIRVRDERLYARLLRYKNLGLGESYMEGWWDCQRLDELIYKVLTARIDKRIVGGMKLLFPTVAAVFLNMQSRVRAFDVAERHYNLDNDLFMSFLDPYNQYSCAYFDGTDDLNEAQVKKMDLICRKLDLKANDRVLDIGCGWGGLAKYMAEKHGCRVTAVNISDRQIEYARETCRGLPVEIVRKDYRDLDGCYDKIVSVGMFEHVGMKNYRTFMTAVHRCLNDGGVFLLHTIGNNESRIKCDPWIHKYIFPNGMLPSIAQIGKAAEGLFVTEDLHNLGPHYEKTLMAWHGNFQKAWPQLKSKHSETFKRMWDFYLLSCAGAFRARDIQLWQWVLTRYGTTQPCCR